MLLAILFVATLAAAYSSSGRSSPYDPRPYLQHARRAVANYTESALIVDLGYSIYRGFRNESAQINNFRGIRFAQDTSHYRWQHARAPLTNRSAVIEAKDYAATCPQAPDAASAFVDVDNSDTSEDCLFLNVQAPAKKNITGDTGLPVLVWIHPGGYGQGGNGFDFTPLIGTNDNRFLVVSIQYRLGAFGVWCSCVLQSTFDVC
jgi:carboxylesterase type B